MIRTNLRAFQIYSYNGSSVGIDFGFDFDGRKEVAYAPLNAVYSNQREYRGEYDGNDSPMRINRSSTQLTSYGSFFVSNAFYMNGEPLWIGYMSPKSGNDIPYTTYFTVRFPGYYFTVDGRPYTYILYTYWLGWPPINDYTEPDITIGNEFTRERRYIGQGDAEIDIISFGEDSIPNPFGITLTPSSQNAQLTLNGAAFYQPVTISDNATIGAVGNPAIITPSVGEHTQLLIDDVPAISGIKQEISGEHVVASKNTKPIPTITFSFTAETAEVYLNEVLITPNTTYPLSENAIVGISVRSEVSKVMVTYENMDTVTLNDEEVKSGTVLVLNGGEYTLNAIGAKAIPAIVVNGEGINTLAVNGESIDPSDMPYTFTPKAGQVNSVYVSGDGDARTITISGTHIDSMTVNNVPVQLPYTVTVTEPLDISVSGEIYQLDVSSKGGAIITRRKKDGTEETITDGSKVHTIVDVDRDQYLTIDGTHILTVSGQDIKTITINGVSVDVSQLPVTISNNNMTASVVIGGFPPSEIHVIGSYIQTASLDGNAVTIGADGSVTLEVVVRDENHFLTINGSQPRDVNLTFNDNGTTDIEMDGQKVNNGEVYATHRDRFISALPEPVPVNFDVDDLSFIKVDGVAYVGNFQVDVSRETNVEVNSSSCVLTIDYGDNSYQITVPQRMVTLTAPHRDGWIFDTWTSNDVGIINPRMVQCNIDLSGKTRAHIVANYQRYLAVNKPNHWN